jgi:hypothetical protein
MIFELEENQKKLPSDMDLRAPINEMKIRQRLSSTP